MLLGWTKTPQHTMLLNSPLTHKGVHTLSPLRAAHGATPETCRFAGLSETWKLRYMTLGVTLSPVVTLAGTTVLSRLCVFDDSLMSRHAASCGETENLTVPRESPCARENTYQTALQGGKAKKKLFKT